MEGELLCLFKTPSELKMISKNKSHEKFCIYCPISTIYTIVHIQNPIRYKKALFYHQSITLLKDVFISMEVKSLKIYQISSFRA